MYDDHQDEPFSEESDNSVGIVKLLGELPAGAILDEEALARTFGRSSVTIKRAVERRELPPPIRMFGKPCWTVGVILAHIEARLDAAKRKAERDAARFSQLCP